MGKLHGDVSSAHRQIAADLEELEDSLNTNDFNLPVDKLAKAYMCIASDWYSLGDDDTGKVLLEKVEKIYPGYFKTKIYEHIKEDQDYDLLIKMLSYNIILLMSEVNFESE